MTYTAPPQSYPPLRLGILGMSPGNGHPYSWSAIFNGYDEDAMATCPFPTIPAYLSERRFPQDSLAHLGRVTHVWTQEPELSRSIAAASRIAHIANRAHDMIGHVDGVLLARDDAANHLEMARPFLAAGLPIFVDKPLATSIAAAEQLLALEKYAGQLFTCSALRYGAEFQVAEEERLALGRVRLVEAITPKDWETYSVHVIEPIVAAFGAEWGLPFRVRARQSESAGDVRRLTMALQNEVLVSITSTGSVSAPLGFRLHGERGSREHILRDTFSAFRSSLAAFVESVQQASLPIPRAETRQVIACIEWGLENLSGES